MACDAAGGALLAGMRVEVQGASLAGFAARQRCQGCGELRLTTRARAHGYRLCAVCEAVDGPGLVSEGGRDGQV